jgi:hypothetical protein
MARSRIARAFDEARDQLGKLLKELQTTIDALPDNPRIQRIGAGKAFSISSKDLGGNWSVFYHDFRAQYQEIIKELDSRGPFTALNRLTEIIDNQQIKSGQKLHPDVVSHLKKLLGE